MTLDFVHVFLVELMKGLVLMMINARKIIFVDTKTVQPHLMPMIIVVQIIKY